MSGHADCGAEFDHDPHGYVTADNQVKACDGSTTKHPRVPSTSEGEGT